MVGSSRIGRKPKAGLEPLERALALYVADKTATEADRANVRFPLARALWESGRERPRALEEARAAQAAWAAAAAEHPKGLRDVTAWLGERDGLSK